MLCVSHGVAEVFDIFFYKTIELAGEVLDVQNTMRENLQQMGQIVDNEIRKNDSL